MREDITKTMHDDHGEPHAYFMTQHPATKGRGLFLKMLKILSVSAGKMLSAFQGVGDIPTDMGGFIDLVTSDQFGGESVGEAFYRLAVQLEAEPELFLEIFRYTTRDGLKLNSELLFDMAYTGNYGEMIVAVAWVLQMNFGDTFNAMKQDFGQAS